MVAGKVNSAASGLRRSPVNAKPKPDSSSAPPLLSVSASAKQQGSGAALVSGSFGVYFPRASRQVQPRPPDVAELLRLVEELRVRESRLKAELLEQKLLGEPVAINVPVLEKVITSKESEIERFRKKIGCLEAENQKLRQENEFLHTELTKQNRKYEEKIKSMQAELSDIKRAVADSKIEREESSSSWNMAAAELIGKSRSFPRRISEEILEPSDGLVRMKFPAPHMPEISMIPPPPLLPRPPVKPDAKVVTPPPPPPAVKGRRPLPPAKVSRVPEVVEFYHSVMRRDSNCRRDTRGGTGSAAADAQAAVATTKDMIGEIKTRSTHLLAIKTDVETQGDFIRLLIKEVEGAAFTDIEAVVSFVKWLDDELSNLVDERAVLRHFDWPEKKADALREAAFGYCDLKKLEAEISSYFDDFKQPCSHALKRMKSLFEKLEHGVYNLSRMRESAAARYKGFQIPVGWMMDSGYVSQIKLASVKLAMRYMKRVSAELEISGSGADDQQELIIQGVKFAFRVHQFAGGFDVETMRAFQELRAKAR